MSCLNKTLITAARVGVEELVRNAQRAGSDTCRRLEIRISIKEAVTLMTNIHPIVYIEMI